MNRLKAFAALTLLLGVIVSLLIATLYSGPMSSWVSAIFVLVITTILVVKSLLDRRSDKLKDSATKEAGFYLLIMLFGGFYGNAFWRSYHFIPWLYYILGLAAYASAGYSIYQNWKFFFASPVPKIPDEIIGTTDFIYHSIAIKRVTETYQTPIAAIIRLTIAPAWMVIMGSVWLYPMLSLYIHK